MNDEEMENETPKNEEEVVETPETSTEEAVEVPVVKDDKDLKSALAQKDHFREKAEKAEADKQALEAQLNKLQKTKSGENPALDVEDYIDISASLDGLDQREKEYLAQQSKLTGKTLGEIRKDEDFQLWQSAYGEKVEKEKALAPSSAQGDEGSPKSFIERLDSASLEEKEKMLAEAGLWKSPRPRVNKTDIGDARLR